MYGIFPPHVMGGVQRRNSLHYSLVENSRVPILLVPPQRMQSEWLLSLIPHEDRIHTSQDGPGGRSSQSRTCEKCGTCHELVYTCPAANRKCYSCRRYGHYASLCTRTSNRRELDQQTMPASNDSDNSSPPVSVNTVHSNPDDSIVQNPTTEISDLKQKFTVLQDEKASLQEECVHLKDSNALLTEQISQCQTEAVMLRKQCSELQTQKEDLFQKMTQFEQETVSLKVVRSDLQANNKDLDEQNSNLKREVLSRTTGTVIQNTKIKELSSQLNQMKHSLSEEQIKSDLLDKQLKRMVIYADKQEDSYGYWKCLCEDLFDDFDKVANMFDTPGNPNPLCNRCGTKSHQRRAPCPATGSDCFRCGKVNHFAAVCKKSGLREKESDEDTSLCIALLDKYNLLHR